MKIYWIVLCVLVGGLFLSPFLLLRNPSGTHTFETLPTVDEQALHKHTRKLVDIPGFRYYENPKGLEEAASYIEEQWRSWGLPVSRQPFEVEGTTFFNVMTTYGPTDGPRVVLGAHYDVCGPRPGADDNASAVAALLEVARMLAQEKPQLNYRVDLVAYILEEPPFFRTEHMGSAHHARLLQDSKVDVKLVIALDMLGYFSDEPDSQSYPLPSLKAAYPSEANFIAVIGRMGDRELVRTVKSRMKGASPLPVYSINAPASLPGIDFSDHLNYWERGIPAVFVTDTSFYRNANYHEDSDTIDTLNFPKLAQVTRGLYGVVISL